MKVQADREDLILMVLHAPPQHPHWSESVDWRAGRWDPMVNAPCRGSPILHVRGREADGRVVEPMHYACGDGDGMMPPFDGWFVPCRSGDAFVQVRPVEWQPLRALPDAAPVGSVDCGECPRVSTGCRAGHCLKAGA